MAITAEMLLKNKDLLLEETGVKEDSITFKRLKEKIGDGEVIYSSLTMEDMSNIGKQANNEYDLTCMAVYKSLVKPCLKDKELQKGLECKSTPYKIVEKIFKPTEIKLLGEKISTLSDFPNGEINEGEIIEKIKNE